MTLLYSYSPTIIITNITIGEKHAKTTIITSIYLKENHTNNMFLNNVANDCILHMIISIRYIFDQVSYLYVMV